VIEVLKPPVLNQTIELEITPIDTVPVMLPNGTGVKVTLHRVSQMLTIGNITVLVVGEVCRLGMCLGIAILGVPPADYTVEVEGVNASVEQDLEEH